MAVRIVAILVMMVVLGVWVGNRKPSWKNREEIV